MHDTSNHRIAAAGERTGRLLRGLLMLLTGSCCAIAFFMVLFHLTGLKSFAWVAAAAGAGVLLLFGIYTIRHIRTQDEILRVLLSSDIELFRHPETKSYPITAEPVILHISELINQDIAAERARDHINYIALQEQINPHFLYNALESIRGKALAGGNREISDMTEALGRYFRYLIGNRENLVTLESEFENIRTYFKIQQFRFGEKYQLEIVPPADRFRVMQCILPKLTLQPIVENAIMHGLEETGAGTITILADLSGEQLYLRVKDDGAGMSADTLRVLNEKLAGTGSLNRRFENSLNTHGVGMQNVSQRLRLIFGEASELCVYSMEGIGTTVELTIPAFTRNEISDAAAFPLQKGVPAVPRQGV